MSDLDAGSDVHLCNVALSDCKSASTISSLTQPNSKAARVCRLHVPLVRDAILRSYAFGFSTDDDIVPVAGVAPSGAFASIYAQPAACLRIIRVAGLRKEQWRTYNENTFLAQSKKPLSVHYVRRTDNFEQWTDPLALALFAKKLAMAIAPEMTHQQSINERLMRELADLEAKATRIDAIEQASHDDDHDIDAYVPGYIAARL